MLDLTSLRRRPACSLSFVCVLAMFPACATKPPAAPATPATAGQPVTEYDMDPIKITAVKGPDGVHIESFDAAELFEAGGAALSDKRYDDAIAAYDRLLKEFADSRYTKAALYNVGLAYQGKKDWAGAVARFKVLSDHYGETSDAKDAQFQLGATYAEMENWPTSAEVFALILQRKDLTADDKIEALGRRGYAQFKLKDLDAAERTFKSAVLYFEQIAQQERLQTDFYLALCRYHLGEIPHERFRAAPLRLPEKQMRIDMDEKAELSLGLARLRCVWRGGMRRLIDFVERDGADPEPSPRMGRAGGLEVAAVWRRSALQTIGADGNQPARAGVIGHLQQHLVLGGGIGGEHLIAAHGEAKLPFLASWQIQFLETRRQGCPAVDRIG